MFSGAKFVAVRCTAMGNRYAWCGLISLLFNPEEVAVLKAVLNNFYFYFGELPELKKHFFFAFLNIYMHFTNVRVYVFHSVGRSQIYP